MRVQRQRGVEGYLVEALHVALGELDRLGVDVFHDLESLVNFGVGHSFQLLPNDFKRINMVLRVAAGLLV